MADELYINHVKVDLLPTTAIALSSVANDLADIKDRQGGFSNTFKLPLTALNRATFDFANKPTSQSDKPYLKLHCRLYSEGVEVVGNGYAVVNSCSDGFNVTLFTGNTGFFEAIEGKRLRDLDTTLYDMVSTPWNFLGVTNNYGTAVSPCFFITDDGTVDVDDREIEASTLYPMMRFSDIVNLIFTQAGFTISGDVLLTLDYINMLFPFVGDSPKQGIQEIEGANVEAYFDRNPEFIYYLSSGGIRLLIFTDDNVQGNDVNLRYNTITGAYILPYAAKIKIKLHVVITIFPFVASSGGFDTIVDLSIRKNGVIVDGSQAIISNPNPPFITIDGEYYVDANAGDVITTTINRSGSVNLQDARVVIGGSNTGGQTKIEFSIIDTLTFGSRWRHNANFPDMTQKDFLKAFMQMFFLTPNTDMFAKNVDFFTFDKLDENKPIAPDWSAYLDTNSPGIEYHSQKYGQQNLLKYKEDANVLKYFGDGSFLIDDETLRPIAEMFTLPYAASENALRMSGINMAKVLRINSDGDKVKPVQRILKAEITNVPYGVNSFIRIRHSVLSQTFDTTISACAIFNYNLDRMIADYGFTLVEMLDRYGMMQVFMLLPSHVFNEIRHDVPVYVAGLGGMCYLNKVTDFMSAKLTKVELIRM